MPINVTRLSRLLVTLALTHLHLAYSQVANGTIIVLNVSKDKVVVAADSRAMYDDPSKPPDDEQCKIAALENKVLFVSGQTSVRFKDSKTDLAPAWRSSDVAREVLKSLRGKKLQGKAHLQALVDGWGNTMVENWNSTYQWHQQQVLSAAQKGKNILTYAFFAEATNGEISSKFVAVVFDQSALPPIRFGGIRFKSCSSCGQRDGLNLCPLGETVVAEQMCREREDHRREMPYGAVAQSVLAIRVAKMTGDCDLTGHVGGPIDALQLTAEGSMIWLRKKKSCPEH